jgi:DNA-binding beta-propeller fold protein YncE
MAGSSVSVKSKVFSARSKNILDASEGFLQKMRGASPGQFPERLTEAKHPMDTTNITSYDLLRLAPKALLLRHGFFLPWLGLLVALFAASHEAQGASGSYRLLTRMPIQANAQYSVAVDEWLNKIYVSGGASSGQDVVAINGRTFAATDVGLGSNANVDLRTDRYWAANVYDGGVIVRNGSTNAIITTILLGYCPVGTTYDYRKNRIWVGAQCGAFNDPVFAIDAATFSVVAGPIGTGGVFGTFIANGANGVLYLTTSGISKRVNPVTFAVTTNAFGDVRAINVSANLLYASSGNNLQILNGATFPEAILATIGLPYAPGTMGINTELNHLYIANPAGRSIQVRNGSTGAVIDTFSLALFGATPNGDMTVDSIRGRIYVIASTSSGPVLFVIEDLITARSPRANPG